jgi:small subunit ribosomal protein S17
MAKKKTDESGEIVDATENDAVAPETEEAGETKPKRAARKAKDDVTEDASVVESVLETAASVAETISEGAAKLAGAIVGAPGKPGSRGKRAEKIGVVASDKMTKTVVVRVDRLIKHPVYRKYVRKRKKFMAHDEFGAKIGDKVRIVETRPLSARKRWRVVEIIQKAEL